jgi:hypothetical protein
MELAGDEKRIQALFSELSLADKRQTPRFEKLWRGAEATSPTPRLSKSLVFVVATLLVIGTGMFAIWLRFTAKDTSIDSANKLTPQQTVAPATPPAPEPQKLALVPPRRQHSHRQRSLARLKLTVPTLQERAAVLANWQSPTDTFMTSPVASSFSSLPQLNQSARDLESFLPKNSQSMKESNQ